MTFDATRESFEQPTTTAEVHRPVRGPWLTTEVAILHSLYPHGGSAAVRAMLPHRTLEAIRGKGGSLRIKCHRPSTLGKFMPRRYENSDAIDLAIRDCYGRAMRKGDMKALAERIGRPAWWVQKRATTLGVTRNSRTRPDAWTAPELALLERWSAGDLKMIARKLREAGFARTPTAIAVQLKRRKIDRTDPDAWSATQLGLLFGVNAKTVADWIERRGLLARKVAWGPAGRFVVRTSELRRWIKANPAYVDLRRVDQPWFWDVMFGGRA